MREFKDQLIKVTDKVICDICGNDCKKEYAHLHASWGYFSDSDGRVFAIDFCESCFYDNIAWLKIKSNSKALDGKYVI
jgi:hypothetical protein